MLPGAVRVGDLFEFPADSLSSLLRMLLFELRLLVLLRQSPLLALFVEQ